MLNQIEPLKDILIDVDPFANKMPKESIQKVYDSLEREEVVIVFPSGEVSRVNAKGVVDGKWHKGFLRFAKKTQSPILPIFIKSKNSPLFYTVSSINKSLATVLLPREMFKKKGKSLEFKIGRLIPYKSFGNSQIDSKTEVKLFKKHLYSIAKGKKGVFATQNCIAHPVKRQEILKELQSCELLGETSDKKKIYLYKYEQGDMAILREIGRLREYTFRKVEEGTGKKRDTDSFDKYYEHIVLWDESDLEIVGSYRVGRGSYIKEYYGIDGFYSNTLFKFKEEFESYLPDSIELGRSFVQPKYWGSRALDYLWQGIGAYLVQNPSLKYMFGPVSLSVALPKDALNLLVAYYSQYYGAKKSLVKEIDPFIMNKQEREDVEKVFEYKSRKDDFMSLRKQLRFYNATVPTLYKQYTELCEEGGVEFLGFNIDKDFNNCVDGLILVDISKMLPKKRERYMKQKVAVESNNL